MADRNRASVVDFRPAGRVLVFSGLALVAVAIGSQARPPDLRAVLPMLVIVGHALWALRYRDDPALLGAAGYQTYFLGFLCTVLSILAAIVHVSRDPKLLEDPQYVCVAMALALSATLVALIAMTALSACADACESRPNVGVPQNLSRGIDLLLKAIANSEVPPVLHGIVGELRQMLRDLKQSVDAARELGGELGRIGPAVGRLDDQVRVLAARLQALAEVFAQNQAQAARYDTSIRQIQQVIDGGVELLRKRIDSEVRRGQRGEAA